LGETANPAIDATEIPLGQWYHVAGVYDGVTAAIYLNGEEKDFDLLSGSLHTGQISAIGRKGNSDSQYWKGDLDDLAIWKRALSAKEIELLASGGYAAGKLPWTGGGQSGIPCPEIVAHRGSSYIAPENTMAAYNLAWDQGSHGVEVDVYLTVDKRIVCIHDSNLKRTTGVDKSVESCTWDEIKDLDAGSWKGSQWAGERIPLLEDAIASIPYGHRLFIELKTGPTIVPYLQPLIENSGKRERIVVITFNYGSAVAVREAMPDIPVMWLVSSIDYSTLINQAVAAGFLGLDASYATVNRDYVNAARAAGLEVYAWTITAPPRLKPWWIWE
jgi:glycerophosphoryl diester phosphodiesterase